MLRILCRLLVLGFCLSLVAMPRPLADDSARRIETVQAPQPVPLDRVKPLVDARRFDEAERMARQLLAEAISTHGDDSLECAQALDALVHVQLALSLIHISE